MPPTTAEPPFRRLARHISIVENEIPGYEQLLENLHFAQHTPIIGITGPPGAGKSTLVNAIIKQLTQDNNKTLAIIAVDPTSPFNYGALLGDRIRWATHYNNPNIYIRSLASRGSLGGLSDKIIEISDVVRAFGFDYILIETVGVGQSEVEIAGLADTTIVALVPEAGDEIQTMKAGLMEIADIFVVNKADRPHADDLASHLRKMLHDRPAADWNVPVIKTIAHHEQGIAELLAKIDAHRQIARNPNKKSYLLAQKAWQLIQKKRMSDLDRNTLHQAISQQLRMRDDFNLYTFVQQYATKY